MTQTVWIIILAIFCALCGYCIGLRRGWKTYENEYDRGYNDALNYCEQHYDMTDLDKMTENLEKSQKLQMAKSLVTQLDDLFEEEERIIDCGEY